MYLVFFSISVIMDRTKHGCTTKEKQGKCLQFVYSRHRSDLSGCLRNQKLDVTCTASGYGQQDEPTETLQSGAKRSAHRSLTEEVQ